MSRERGLASAAVSRADRLTREGIAFKPLAVYIPEAKVQDEGVEVMVQRREMTSTAVASQKIEHQPRASKAVSAVVILVAHAGEIWGKPVRLQVGSTYTLEMYDGVLT